MGQSLNVTVGRFTVLNKKPNRYIMYFDKSFNLNLDDYLTIIETDSSNVPTGRQLALKVTAKYLEPLQFTNQSFNQFNLKRMDFPWIDYSSTSTIVGFSSYVEKVIKYQIIGSTMIVQFHLEGTSNSTSLTFTIPQNSASSPTRQYVATKITNNGTQAAAPGQAIVNNSSNVVTCTRDNQATAWTASGSKRAIGTIIIQLA
jgi:hypothetical protein